MMQQVMKAGVNGQLPSASEFNASNLTQIVDYTIGKHLGQGAHASVKQAVHVTTGFVLAIKVYEKYNLMDATRRKSV